MLKILVADDHQLFRQGLKALISELDDDVIAVEAGDYVEALEKLSADGPFGLILLDLRMPRMTGFDGIRAVRDAAPDSPIMVISAFETRENVAGAFAAGANGFLPKSAAPTVMLHALRLVMLGERYIPTSILYARMDDPPAPSTPSRPEPGTALPSAEEARARLAMLTRRQTDVLALIGQGQTNRDIARILGISEGTVKVHVGAILKTFGATNRTQAALLAIELGVSEDRIAHGDGDITVS